MKPSSAGVSTRNSRDRRPQRKTKAAMMKKVLAGEKVDVASAVPAGAAPGAAVGVTEWTEVSEEIDE